MRRKRITVLHLIASRGLGGAEKVLLTLLQNAELNELNVILGIFQKKRQEASVFSKEAKKTGATVEVLNFGNPYDLSQVVGLFHLIRKYRPDIIHTHGYKSNTLGFLLSRPFGIPIVTTVHGLYQNSAKTHVHVNLSLRFLKYFDAVIAVSDNIRDQLTPLHVPSNKVITIHNVPPRIAVMAVDNRSLFRKEIGIRDDEKMIGFVGRLERVKGCDLLIEAVSKLVLRGFHSQLVIVGEGPEKETLMQMVKNLGLGGNVHFCGFREDINNVYQSLDMLVLPSRHEGIPLVMLEAMAQGVPIVATRVGGIPEVITDGVQGLLSTPENPETLADRIMSCFINPEETKKRVAAAKKKILECYDVKRWLQKYREVYNMATKRVRSNEKGRVAR